jgi:LysM repeat protein
LVAVPGRPWRSLAAPAAFLLAVTLGVVLLRAVVLDGGGGSTPATPATQPAPAAKAPATPRVYTVRAGDTLATIAAATGVSIERLRQLNPKVEPTSLFIGDRIRLR